MSTPGLVSRKIIGTEFNAIQGKCVLVEEVWDLTAPGCPVVVVNQWPEFKISKEADRVTRRLRMRERPPEFPSAVGGS